MPRSLFRQDTQIRNSDVYSDVTAPSEAAFETNPTALETDLNNIRSQLHNFLNVQTGNWWDDLVAPATLESGTQRGINDLNSALHLVEKKRILRDVHSLVDITVAAGTAATGTINTDTGGTAVTPVDGETVVINDGINPAVTFEFDTDASVVQTNTLRAVDISGAADEDDVKNALITAITNAPVLFVSAADGGAGIVNLTHDQQGSFGNQTVTETVTSANFTVTGLSGGAGAVTILGTGELPTNTTAAVGAVTTLGTVVAAHTGTFGQHSLDEVAGSNTLNPKNLVAIFDGSTRDPILDSEDRRIWGLLQTEDATDGHTITDAATTRAQISYVVVSATGDDLIPADGADIGGQTINYCSRERVRLEDLTEADFLKGAIVDTPGAATAVSRQDVYDNQGTTPVDLTTNATLDLEGPGLIWAIRDDLEANLFRIVEGSAGGTSVVEISAGTDTFDVNAAVNDFLNGASFDTGAAGTTINVGTTANQIDSGGSLTVASGGAQDLNFVAALELNLTDSYRAGSTWSLADGVALANSSAEWDAFEAEFGEVSLLNAITQASNISGITKTAATVTVTTTANNDVSLGDGNLDAPLGDLSGGSFFADHDIYLNGQFLRLDDSLTGANNHDVYPGTSLAAGQVRFEFPVKVGDEISVISRA